MAPKPYLDASVSSRKGFFKSAKANMGAIAHFFFKVWKASSAAAVSETGWFFNLLFPQPSRSFSGLAIHVKFFMKRRKYPMAPINFLIPVYIVGGPMHAISSTPFCPGSIPLAEISWPKYNISSLKKWHLDGLSFNPWWAKWSNTACSHVRWSSGILEYMITLSKYTMANERLSSPKQFCIRCWKVAGALQRPYCMRRNSYTPILPTVNAVYWQDSSDTLTCLKPLLRSMVEK